MTFATITQDLSFTSNSGNIDFGNNSGFITLSSTSGGIEINSTSADITFNTNQLFLDRPTLFVGINNSIPLTRLHVGSGTGVPAWFPNLLTVEGVLIDTGLPITRLALQGTIESALILHNTGGTANLNMFSLSSFGDKTYFQILADDYSLVQRDLMTFDNSNGFVGFNNDSPLALLNPLSTSEQLRLSYDATNFSSFTVGSGGLLTVTPTGRITLDATAGNIIMRGGATNNYFQTAGNNATLISGVSFVDLLLNSALKFRLSSSGIAITTPVTMSQTLGVTGTITGPSGTWDAGGMDISGTIESIPTNPTLSGVLFDSINMDFPYAMSISNEYAYVVGPTSNSLSIIDISTPTSPTLVSSLIDAVNLNGTRGVAVANGYAYVLATIGDRLTIVDVSDPSAPVVTGSLTDSTNINSPRGVYISGKYAYVASDTGNSLAIIDISDPIAPTLTGSLVDAVNLDAAISVYVLGNYAYVAVANTDSLVIIDITDKTTPTIIGSVADAINMARPRSVFVSGKYAYVVASNSDSLVVIDVSDPAIPVVAGSLLDSTNMDQPIGMFLSGNYVYVASFTSSSLAIIDVSDPTTPILTSSLLDATNMGGAIAVAVEGKHAYVLGNTVDSLAIVDINGIASSSASIGNLEVGYLSVDDNAVIHNNLYTGGLNVGPHGIHTSGDMSTSFGIVSVNPSSTIEINSAEQFEALATAGVITISTNTNITIHAGVSTSSRFVIESGVTLGINSLPNADPFFLNYSGTGDFFSGAGTVRIGELLLFSSSTGTLVNIDGGSFVVQHSLIFGFDSLGSVSNGSVVIFRFMSFGDIGGGLTITDIAGTQIFSIDHSGTGLTSPFFIYNQQLSNTQMSLDIVNLRLGTGGSVLDISSQVNDLSPLTVDRVTTITGDLFKQSILTDATIISVAPGSPLSGSITAMADNGDSGTTILSTTVYFDGELVTQSGTTSYNDTFRVFNVVAGVSYDIQTDFVANDATGQIDSARIEITLTAGHGIVVQDDLKIITSNFYNGFVIALDFPSTDVLTVNGTFIATDTGLIERELSLDQTDPRVLAKSNPQIANSQSIAFGNQNANTQATAVLDGTYVTAAFSGITINQVTEGFRLVDDQNCVWEYIRNEPFNGTLSGSVSMLKSGSTANYRMAMSTNSVAPTFATAPYVPIEVKTTQITKPFTFSAILEKGDTIELMVAGDGTSNSLTFTGIIGGAR